MDSAHIIVQEILRDREAGAARLVAECREPLRAAALSLCGDPALAEDLVFRTFERVLDRVATCRDESVFEAWMKTILRNEWFKTIRGATTRNTILSGAPSEVEGLAEPEEGAGSVAAAVDASLLRDAIEDLPDEMREAVVLHYFMGLPLLKAAKLLAVPVGTVKSRLHYARALLAAKLGAAAKKPGGKALLVALALLALTAAGAAGVAISGALRLSDETSAQPTNEQLSNRQTVQLSNCQTEEEQTMNKATRSSIIAATSLAVTAGFAKAGNPTVAADSSSALYVQDGLVACWDGIENAGVGVHDASATVWRDIVGGREFALHRVTVDADRMTFAGSKDSYGNLSATDTTATFVAAKSGTLEIVYASRNGTTSQVILQAPANPGMTFYPYVSDGNYSIVPFSGSSNKPTFVFESGTATNTVAIRYADGAPVSAIGNGATLPSNVQSYASTTGSETIIGTRASRKNGHFPGSIYCIRLYSRQLTDAEIAANQAIDRMRFQYGIGTCLQIAGTPEGVGSPSPAYGIVAGLANGATLPCSAPSSWTNAAAAAVVDCSGWKLYDMAGNIVSNGLGNAFTYVHPDPAAFRRLEWQWDVSCLVTASAGANGSVTFNDGFYAVGSEVVVTAVPDAGYAFAGWLGLPEGVASANPLHFTMGMETNGVALVARFCPLESSYALDFTDGDLAIEVAAGCTHTVTEVVGNASANLTVSGGGLLVLPDADLSSAFADLVIDGVMVRISSESQLGGGPVTMLNGGGILCTEDFTQAARPITILSGSTGVVEVVSDKTIVFMRAYFVSASATLVKRGTGTLQMNGEWQTAQCSGARWIVDEGTLLLYGQFDPATAAAVVEVHEDGTFLLDRNLYSIVVGDVVLRGGRMIHSAAYHDLNGNLLRMTTAHRRIAMRNVTALPSRDGRHSFLTAGMFDAGAASVFDVREGAVLDLDSSLQNSGGAARSMRKTGGGTLRLLKSPFAYGGIEVSEGTLALAGRNVRIARGVPLHIADGAHLVLENGSALGQAQDVPSPLIAEAAVWLDATQLAGFLPGEGLACIPNLGSAGGVFEANISVSSPLYRPDTLNGLPALDGLTTSVYRGLKLVGAYSNTGSELSTYLVASGADITFADSTHGLRASPFSFGTTKGGATAADAFRYEYLAANQFNIYFSGNGSKMAVSNDAVSLASGPFLSVTLRDAAAASVRQYRGDGTPEFSQEMTGTFPDYDISTLGLFARVNSASGDLRSSYSWPGQIGELLVFSRKLTASEDEAVRGYLAKKWFASTREWAALPTNAPGLTLPVTVEAGDSAALCFDKDASASPFTVAKLGAGALDDFSATPGGMTLDVREGRAAFTPAANVHCPAAVWFDAADSAALSTNAAGAVLSVRNKGHAGGEFLPRNDNGSVTATPTVGKINGRTAVVFDGDDFLRTRAFTNSTPRELYVYLVRQRDEYVKNAGLFVHVASTSLAESSDDAATGSVLGYESADKQISFDTGSTVPGFKAGVGADGVPVIDFFHAGDYRVLLGELAAGNAPTNVAKIAAGGTPSDADRATVNDLFHIGSRIGAGDEPKTFLKGRIGELIAFEEPLNASQVDELLGYLRKKWLGAGEGSDTPPRWFAPAGTEVETGGRLAVRQAAGTELGQDGATVALSSYASEGAVSWTRDAALTNALFSVAGDITFGGPVNLTLNPFPRKGYSRTLATYGGDCTGFVSSWTCAGEGMSGNPKVRHLSAEKRILLEFVSPVTVILLQ